MSDPNPSDPNPSDPNPSDPNPLPDSLDDWPVSPRHILGVPSDADKRTIRTAYARLLRIYRPEDEPEKFNRILQARDQLLRIAASRPAGFTTDFNTGGETGPRVESDDQPATPSPSPGPLPKSAPGRSPTSDDRSDDLERSDDEVRRFAAVGATDPATADRGEFSQEHGREDTTGPAVVPSPVTPDSAWERAIAGEYDAAYAELVTVLRESDPQSRRAGEAAVRLYWLQRLVPKVAAPDTQPVDRLLNQATAIDPDVLHSLLLAEAGGNEVVLLRDSLRELMRHDPEAHLALLKDRWHAAVRADAVDVIRDDLEIAFCSIARSIDQIVLMAAFELSLSPKSVTLLGRCLDELDENSLEYTRTPYGSSEAVIELVQESYQRYVGYTITPRDWVADLLRDAPVHPVLRKHYFEERLAVWWRSPDLVTRQLQEFSRLAPLMANRLLGVLESLTHNEPARLEVAAEAAIEALRKIKLGPKLINRFASISRTFLVSAEAIGRHLRQQSPGDERVDWPLLRWVRDDVALRLLTAGWVVYAVPLTLDDVRPS